MADEIPKKTAPGTTPENPQERDLSDIQNPTPEEIAAIADDMDDVPLDKRLSREAGSPQISFAALKKNPKQIMYAAGGVVLLLVILMVYSCQPRNGSMAFGICSAFLELNTPYPHTLRYTDIEGSRTAVRIYFTNVDPFGEFKQEMIECTFGPDEKMGMKMTQVTRNRRPVDPVQVEKFNVTIPTIMASDPYLVLPPEWKNPLVKEYYQGLPE